MLTPQTFNNWRVFPRLIAFFMAYMWLQFNDYFFSIPMAQQSEWAFAQYAVITATFVGFAKFYMESGGKNANRNDP
jgi:hypothetical protein